MKQISNKNIKAFSERFGYRRKGRNSLVPISNEQARQAIDNFITLNGDGDIKPSFVETRLRLLKICLEEETASKRWTKVRDFLLENLESQVLSVYITQSDLQNDEVKSSHIMSYLMDPNSFLCQCIKAVVLFNITDDKAKLPNELLIDFGSGIEHSFPLHKLNRHNILLIAKTKDGRIIEKELPYNGNNAVLTINSADSENKISWTYSVLKVKNTKKSYKILHDAFYKLFEKLHKDIVIRYNLDSSKNPSYWFSKLSDPMDNYSSKERQRKILKELTGQYMMAWNWKKEGKTIYDISKTAKIYFPEVKEKIVSIRPIYPIPWKPYIHLLDENFLRNEIIVEYLKRFEPEDRERLFIENLQSCSVFNLESFRLIVDGWERKRDIPNIILMLQTLLSIYRPYNKGSKERSKMIQYVKISKIIFNSKGKKDKMGVYRMVSPNEKVNTVEQRYLRIKNKLKEKGYDVDDPNHLSEIVSKWNISEVDLIL